MAYSPERYDVLNYPFTTYTPIGLKKLGEVEVRKEYSRLRSIAIKRLKRLSESEFSKSNAYQQNVGKFPKISDIKTEGELRYRLINLVRFTTSPMSTIRGQRANIRQTVITLKEHGYDFVTSQNLPKFGEFMDYARSVLGGILYDSERIANLFSDNAEKSPDDLKKLFDRWLDKQESEDSE